MDPAGVPGLGGGGRRAVRLYGAVPAGGAGTRQAGATDADGRFRSASKRSCRGAVGMNVQPSNPHFLVLEKYALSKAKARQAVVAVLQRCDVQCPKEGWESLRLTWKDGNPPASPGFAELVDEARGTGIVQRLQEYLDRKDP